MFTGLVEDIGSILSITKNAQGASMRIGSKLPSSELVLGESIAVDGACLTVTSIGQGTFDVDASPETLERTTIGKRRMGDRVHLERALAIGQRLGGHFVLGHVDGVGTIIAKQKSGNAWLYDVRAPESVSNFLIDKGSITVDGVSLTVNWCKKDTFGLAIIPFTGTETKLLNYAIGQQVNLEADVLGKYVHRFMHPNVADDKQGDISMEMLKKAGFH